MPAEIVSVLAGGQLWTAWLKTSVKAAVNESARSFSMSIAAEIGPDATASVFQANTEVAIFAAQGQDNTGQDVGSAGPGDLIFTGYVDKYNPSFDAESSQIEISGRGKGADAVDCSCDHTKGTYKNKSLLDIAKDQDAFGINYTSDTDLAPIERWDATPGQSVFHGLEHLSRHQGVTQSGQADGSIRITKAGETAKRHAGYLLEGWNIKKGSAEHDCSNRHSKITAHGQKHKGTGKESTQIKAEASDDDVPRNRPLTLLHDGDADQDRIQQRADNRRDKAAGEALRASITTVGWRDAAGTLWEPGYLIFTSSPFLQLSQDMLIESVDYQQSGEGTTAELALVDPRAHGGKGGGVDKSGKGWKSGAGSKSS